MRLDRGGMRHDVMCSRLLVCGDWRGRWVLRSLNIHDDDDTELMSCLW